jgi:hypothetical protein
MSDNPPTLQWFRWWLGTASDPKLTTVARRSKQKRATVVAVWAALLEAAADTNNGGAFDTPLDEIAAILEMKPEQVSAIVSALEARGMLLDNAIVNWPKRQYASDSSTARVRKHREAVKEQAVTEGETLQKRSGNKSAALQKRHETPSETETETETEERRERRAPPDGDAAPAAPVKDLRPAEKPKTPTAVQRAVEEAWAAHDLGPLPKAPLKGYSGLVKLVQQHGVPKVQAWAAHVSRDPPPVPEGANAWDWFCARFRAALNRPFEWDGTRGKPKPNRGLLPATRGKVETDEWGQQIT